MRILFLSSSHNGLSQRLWVELLREGHIIQVQLATSHTAMIRSVNIFNPDLIIAPFLKVAVPEEIWKNHVCLIVHPGIKGDRGPSSLDWAIMKDEQEWGVTIIQAAEEMDAGAIWDSQTFPMRRVSKSNLYRHEVTQAASQAILRCVKKFEDPSFFPEPLDYKDPEVKGRWNDPIKRIDREINWRDDSDVIIKKIRAADSNPGVLENNIFDESYFLFGPHKEGILKGNPGEIIAKRHGAVCIGTGDGSIWVSHLRKKENGIKLKAADALGDDIAHLNESSLCPFDNHRGSSTYKEIWFEERGDVGYLHFDFYNGAMSTEQCVRLRKAFMLACQKDHKVLVLKGGKDIWSNGIHLNVIENAVNPADESWDNIVAIDDLVREIIHCESKLVISAMAGNAGAGGVILALAADYVYARNGVILNPHYKKMGLYGSEYWTYLLPKRVGREKANQLTEACESLDALGAKEIGLIDDCFGDGLPGFEKAIDQKADDLSNHEIYDTLLTNKRLNRLKYELANSKSLDSYRNEELAKMWNNFYGEGSSYHDKRYSFVHKGKSSRHDAKLKIMSPGRKSLLGNLRDTG